MGQQADASLMEWAQCRFNCSANVVVCKHQDTKVYCLIVTPYWKNPLFKLASVIDTSMNYNDNMQCLDHCLWQYFMARMTGFSLVGQDFSEEKIRQNWGMVSSCKIWIAINLSPVLLLFYEYFQHVPAKSLNFNTCASVPSILLLQVQGFASSLHFSTRILSYNSYTEWIPSFHSIVTSLAEN